MPSTCCVHDSRLSFPGQVSGHQCRRLRTFSLVYALSPQGCLPALLIPRSLVFLPASSTRVLGGRLWCLGVWTGEPPLLLHANKISILPALFYSPWVGREPSVLWSLLLLVTCPALGHPCPCSQWAQNTVWDTKASFSKHHSQLFLSKDLAATTWVCLCLSHSKTLHPMLGSFLPGRRSAAIRSHWACAGDGPKLGFCLFCWSLSC